MHLRKALFKGFPNIPHIPLPTGHSVSTNQATMAPTPENAPCWHLPHRPREMCKGKHFYWALFAKGALAPLPRCCLFASANCVYNEETVSRSRQCYLLQTTSPVCLGKHGFRTPFEKYFCTRICSITFAEFSAPQLNCSPTFTDQCIFGLCFFAFFCRWVHCPLLACLRTCTCMHVHFYKSI